MTSSKSNSKEPYDEFIATIKLVTGEEILTKVIVNHESDDNQIILDNPLLCHEVRSHGANVPMGYKFEPWIKMSDEDVYVLALDKVITLTEIKDIGVIETYEQIVAGGFKRTHPELNRDMGYISSVDRAREMIEKMFKSDDASKNPKEG